MSAIGLPMVGHVEPHFDARGLCCCPCADCTLRLTQFCVCEDCPCEGPEDHLTEPVRPEDAAVLATWLNAARDLP